MGALRTVAMGLVIVFVDAGDGLDWVADPVGWILVLTWPPSSVAHLDESLGWLFSVPAIAFCFLMADAAMDVTAGGMRTWLAVLRGLFGVVGVLPVLLYGGGWEWLEVPAAVLAVVANVALVLALWQVGGAADEDDPEFRERLRKRRLSTD